MWIELLKFWMMMELFIEFIRIHCQYFLKRIICFSRICRSFCSSHVCVKKLDCACAAMQEHMCISGGSFLCRVIKMQEHLCTKNKSAPTIYGNDISNLKLICCYAWCVWFTLCSTNIINFTSCLNKFATRFKFEFL